MATSTTPSKAPTTLPPQPDAPVQDDREQFGGFSDRAAPVPTPDPKDA